MYSWGSTYGAVKTAARQLIEEGLKVSHAHVKYLNPLPKNTKDVLSGFKHVIIPEMNNGQFVGQICLFVQNLTARKIEIVENRWIAPAVHKLWFEI